MLAIIVDTLNDEIEDDSTTSLREAISLAAENPGEDTITFSPSLDGSVHLTLGPLELYDSSGPISISGTSKVTTIDTGGDTLFVPSGTTAAITGLTITGSQNRGVANAGTLTLTDSTVSGNLDGGIINFGSLTLIGSTVSDNVTDHFRGGGGILNQERGPTLTLINSTVSGNLSTTGGGGGIKNSWNATLIDSTITGNSVISDNSAGGAGIDNWNELTLIRSTVSHNSNIAVPGGESGGGGIKNRWQLTLEDSVVSHNSTNTIGGGIASCCAGVVGVTLNRSTVSDNSADASGGGIHTGLFASLELTNSTISGNSTGGDGGGLVVTNGYVTLNGTTVADNSAGSGGGIHVLFDGDWLTMRNSIVAGNRATTGPDVRGIVNSLGSNLIQDSSDSVGFGVAGDLVDADPRLGTLKDNGGFTWTHDLMPDSPAIDAVAMGFMGIDQRGVVRPQGTAADIGAFEFESLEEFNPFVHSVTLNGDIPDPSDLSTGDQPSSWMGQRSDIKSMQINFSKDILATAADVRLVNLGFDAPADEDQPVSLAEEQVTVQGSVLNIAFEEGQLTDGVYQVEVLPTVTGLSGDLLDGDGDGIGGDHFLMTGDPSNRLYRRVGDWNGDGGISIFDFATFAYWFNQPVPAAPAYVDLNGDQGISIFDFTVYAEYFGRGVTFPPLAMSSPREGVDAANRETASSSRAARREENRFDAVTGQHDRALLNVLLEWSERSTDARLEWL